MRFLCLGFLVPTIVFAACGPALADSVSEEAQTSCNPRKDVFEIRPFLFGGDTSRPDAGFAAVATSSSVSCSLKNIIITARIVITPPGDHHCEGGGYSALKSLRLGARELLPGDVEIGTVRAECDSIASGVFVRLSRLDVVVGKLDSTLRICRARGPTTGKAVESCIVQRYNLSTSTPPGATYGERAAPP